MTDRLAVDEADDRSPVDEPGWYTTTTPVDAGSETEIVWLRCGNSHVGILQRRYPDGTIDGHSIDDDGRVEPSVRCPNDDCAWHETIRLEGWPP